MLARISYLEKEKSGTLNPLPIESASLAEMD
jgi:hypothetical protein